MPEVRLSAYLRARQTLSTRRDAIRRNNSGKTSSLKCNPPNKKCGDRCIPPNWNCRITGGGLDSHSRVVEFDPVKGTAGIIRGTKNVIEGYKKGDPEKIARGIKGVERGIVKLTPGNTIEDKQRFRKRLKVVANTVFIGSITAVAAYRSHQLLKRGFPDYRDGLGAEIDRSARQAVDRVMDTWDTGVDRLGVGGIFNTGRARIAGQGAAAAARIGYQNTVQEAVANRMTRPARLSNYLSTRARLRAPGVGVSGVHAIDELARTQGLSRNQWEALKARQLYSLEVGAEGRRVSMFAAPAAHELLARQWGFQLEPNAVRRSTDNQLSGTLQDEATRTLRQLRTSMAAMHTQLTEDLRRRRLEPTPAGIRTYADQLLAENPSLIVGSQGRRTNAQQRQRAEANFRSRIRSLIEARTAQDQATLARNTYNDAVSFYDSYFKDAASRLAVGDNNLTTLRATDPDSPLGDAMLGLARFNAAQRVRYRSASGFGTGGPRYPVNIQSRDGATFINGYYFHRQVQRNNTPYTIRDAAQAVRYAQGLSGQSISTVDEAAQWFTNNNFNVQIGRRSTGNNNPVRPPTPPSPLSVTNALPRGTRPARRALRPPTQEQIRALYIRRGYTPEDAARLAAERFPHLRRDAAPSTTRAGKPCGASHIPKAHKCHTNTTAPTPESGATPQVAANKHDKAYRTRQIASIVARVGAVGGGATFAIVAARQGVKNKDVNAFKAAFTGATVAFLGVRSLQRERAVTHNTKELVDRYEKLKQNEDVDPATVDKLQKFIQDTDMDSQRVPTKFVLGGVGGYFDSAKPDRIHITSEGMTIPEASKDRSGPKAYTKGVEKYMRYRAGLTSERIIDAENTSLENMKRNFSASHWIGNPEGKQDYLLAHEIGHAIHYRGNFATPKAVVVNGKRYEGKELEAELKRSTSYYGQSDLVKKSESRDNYYEQGNRLETYSENFALYVGNARAMKEIFPVSYEWTRQTTEYALAQPPKAKPRPFIDIVKELSEGTERFEPKSLRSRRDAPEDDKRILDLLAAIKNAAINGDVPTTLQLFSEAQSLPQDVRFMFGAFLETAFMYSQINQSRSDTL